MEILRSLTIDKHNLFNSSKNTFYPNSLINLQSSRSSASDISSIPLKLNIHNQQNKIDFSNAQLKRIIKTNKKMNKYIKDDKLSSDIVYKTIKTRHHKKKKDKLIANEDSAIFESIKPKYNQRNQIKIEIIYVLTCTQVKRLGSLCHLITFLSFQKTYYDWYQEVNVSMKNSQVIAIHHLTIQHNSIKIIINT